MGSDSLTGLIRTVPICKKKYSQKDQLEEDPVTDAARLQGLYIPSGLGMSEDLSENFSMWLLTKRCRLP